MIDVEVFGEGLAPEAPSREEILSLCTRAAHSRGIEQAHVAIEFVGERRIAQLNARHRGKHGPTDVLSFPIDGVEPLAGAVAGACEGPGEPLDASSRAEHPGGAPRELGDILICPQHTADVGEAIVHGMLHLLGMDHERDHGEMLALQRRLLAEARG